MEDLISKRTIIDGLEFVIKHGIETDGAHSISAEAMLEFVRELPIAEVGTNLAEVGTDVPDNNVGELISREQAIEALGELATFTEDWSCHTWMYTDDVYNAIEQLPPIQPEITHEQAIDYLQSTGWMQEHDLQMMLDGVHRLAAQPEPHWIPVADGLPNIREDVLISYYDEVMVGWLNDDGTWFAEEYGRLNMNDIAAWQPLPEPYKEQRHE